MKKGAEKGTGAAIEQPTSDNIFDYTNEKVREIIEREGEFEVDAPSSKGLETRGICPLENNAHYEGQWKGDARHGFGVQVWSDGSMYQGLWEEDKANGRGRLIHADGDVYEGDW